MNHTACLFELPNHQDTVPLCPVKIWMGFKQTEERVRSGCRSPQAESHLEALPSGFCISYDIRQRQRRQQPQTTSSGTDRAHKRASSWSVRPDVRDTGAAHIPCNYLQKDQQFRGCEPTTESPLAQTLPTAPKKPYFSSSSFSRPQRYDVFCKSVASFFHF